MPWRVYIWLVAVIMQCGLLGISMYQLVQITDLEADMVNPHEASRNFNNLVIPEYATQAALTLLFLFTGNWFIAVLQITVLAYNIYQIQNNKHFVDVTEIFRQIVPRRKAMTAKLIAYVLLFVWTIYRAIEVVVLALLTPQGKNAARAVLREAAASLH